MSSWQIHDVTKLHENLHRVSIYVWGDLESDIGKRLARMCHPLCAETFEFMEKGLDEPEITRLDELVLLRARLNEPDRLEIRPKERGGPS